MDNNITTNVLKTAKYIGEKAETPGFWESTTTAFFIPIILILIGIIIFLILEKFEEKKDKDNK